MLNNFENGGMNYDRVYYTLHLAWPENEKTLASPAESAFRGGRRAVTAAGSGTTQHSSSLAPNYLRFLCPTPMLFRLRRIPEADISFHPKASGIKPLAS